MSTKIYKFLIYIAFIAILIIVVGQVMWTTYSRKMIVKSHETLSEIALTKVVTDYNLMANKRRAALLEDYSFRNTVRIIDSLFKAEISTINADAVYSFALRRGDEVIYKSDLSASDESIEHEETWETLDFDHKNPPLEMCVVFPTTDVFNLQIGQLEFWWLISMIGFIIIIMIGYLIMKSVQANRRETWNRIKVINNIAHEFKTPIASIKLTGEMLMNEDVARLPDRVKRYGELVQFEVKRLQRQLEQFQNIVLLDEGQVMLRFDYIHINDVIRTLVDRYLLVRTDYCDRIVFQADTTNDMIYADLTHMENVITNLIENAIKYGGDNVIIHIRTTEKEKGVNICVSDNGAGITRHHQKHVFDRFYRATPSNRQDIPGHGIGLYYVKTILMQMGASIELYSVPGKGARFDIFFPHEIINH